MNPHTKTQKIKILSKAKLSQTWQAEQNEGLGV